MAYRAVDCHNINGRNTVQGGRTKISDFRFSSLQFNRLASGTLASQICKCYFENNSFNLQEPIDDWTSLWKMDAHKPPWLNFTNKGI